MTNTNFTPAQAIQQNNRHTDGTYATKIHSENDTFTPPAVPDRPWAGAGTGEQTGKPFIATVQPQAWIRNNAVDSGSEVEFDIASLLHNMDDTDRVRLAETIGYGDLDYIYETAVDQGLVEEGFGPYYVHIDEQDLDEWLDDNPAWQPDGETPHPTGGYTSVYREGDDFLECRNRDGKLHRLDGPAHHMKDTTKAGELIEETYWSVNGEPHRVDGPAAIRSTTHPNGSSETTLEYWVGGKLIASERTTVDVNEPRPGWVIVEGRPVQQDKS